MGWRDKNFEVNYVCTLLKQLPVSRKSDGVSRNQSAASENQYNLSSRIPNPRTHAKVDAHFSLV